MRRWLAYLWYQIVFWASVIFLTLGFGLRLAGRKNVPRTGPVLIIANHQSFFDPLIVGVSSPRPLYSLARRTLFVGFFGTILRSLGAIELDLESTGKEGLKTILGYLEKGEAVVVYPEGTRTDTGKMGPLQPGVQLLIRRTRCPVLPIGLAGAFEALPHWKKTPEFSPLLLPAGKSSIAVVVGKPLDGERLAKLSREALLAELTRELQSVVDQAEKMRRKA